MITPADIRRLQPEQYEFLWRSLLREEYPHDYQHVDGYGVDCIVAGTAVQAYHHQGGPWSVVQRKFREDLDAARASGLAFKRWVFATTFPFSNPKHREWLTEQIAGAQPLTVEIWGEEALASYVAKHPRLASLVGLLQEIGSEGSPLEIHVMTEKPLDRATLLDLALGESERLLSAMSPYPRESLASSVFQKYEQQLVSVLPAEMAGPLVRAIHAIAGQEKQRVDDLARYIRDNGDPDSGPILESQVWINGVPREKWRLKLPRLRTPIVAGAKGGDHANAGR